VVTTVNDDGTPQSTAVWTMLDDDGLIRTSVMTSRHKYANLVKRPVATLFYLDPASPFRTLEVRADVQLSDDDEGRSFTRKIIESYGANPDHFPTLTDPRAILTFLPRRIVAFGN
jgi:PPOX class probable F420-dependent enzyme